MSSDIVKYVDEIPFKTRLELCNILDFNNDWRTLGGTYMNFDCYELFRMEQAVKRRDSPTEELLSTWGAQNHTVVELFKLLYAMKHYRALLLLKPYVKKRYHKCIPEGSSRTESILNNSVSIISEETDNLSTEKQEENLKLQPAIKPEAHPNEEPTRKVSDPFVGQNTIGSTPHIPYQELMIATNRWNKMNFLGSGGFGTVFKGFWRNTPIAVKRLEVKKSARAVDTSKQCEREQAITELNYLNSCRHDNILPLYGVCFEGGNYCLVYKFMPNGSLEDRLQMKNQTRSLSWQERLNIAKGAALGLQFLHSKEPPLIHGDIKSANILLNAHMEPVIGDFGLTQEGPIEKATHVTLKRGINGTRAYLPQEFLYLKKLSTKVDVYGFGITLFEMATGMRVLDSTRKSYHHLKELVEKCADDMSGLYDKNAPQPLETNIAYSFLKIGKLCTQENPKDRPEMIQVYNMLCGTLHFGEILAGGVSGINSKPTLAVNFPLASGARSPIRNLTPNLLNSIPTHKFQPRQFENKIPPHILQPGVPYMPPPIQILQSHNPPFTSYLQQNGGSLNNENVRAPLDVGRSYPRFQQTGSQMMNPHHVPPQNIYMHNQNQMNSPPGYLGGTIGPQRSHPAGNNSHLENQRLQREKHQNGAFQNYQNNNESYHVQCPNQNFGAPQIDISQVCSVNDNRYLGGTIGPQQFMQLDQKVTNVSDIPIMVFQKHFQDSRQSPQPRIPNPIKEQIESECDSHSFGNSSSTTSESDSSIEIHEMKSKTQETLQPALNNRPVEVCSNDSLPRLDLLKFN